jgi:hypothetical protein
MLHRSLLSVFFLAILLTLMRACNSTQCAHSYRIERRYLKSIWKFVLTKPATIR